MEKTGQKINTEAQKYFDNLWKSSVIGVCIVDIDGNFIKVNPKLCEIVGYQEDDLLSVDFLDITHPEDLKIDLKLYNDVLEKKISGYEMIKRYYRKDKTIVWIKLNVTGIFKKDGSFDYFISQIRSINEEDLNVKSFTDLIDDKDKINDLLEQFVYTQVI